jgi:rhomboid protease GluP
MTQIVPPELPQEFPGTLPPNPLNRVSYPTVTYALIAVTFLVFIVQVATQVLLGTDIPALLGMKENSLIVQGQVWRLLTPVFLHANIADGWEYIFHIGFNMYALWIIGGRMERAYGHGKFTVLYFLSGYAGNVFSFLFQTNPSLGASTAIFGLLAAEGVLLYQNRKLIRDSRSMLQNIITIGVINLLIGTTGGIDNWGHLGGLLGGMAFGWFAGPLLDVIPYGGGVALVDKRTKQDAILAFLVVFLTFTVLVVIGMMDPLRHFS